MLEILEKLDECETNSPIKSTRQKRNDELVYLFKIQKKYIALEINDREDHWIEVEIGQHGHIKKDRKDGVGSWTSNEHC